MFIEEKYASKMKRAFKKMICCNQNIKINSRNYEKIRKEEALLQKGIANNRVSVVDKQGKCLSIPKEKYYSQIGHKNHWDFVSTSSKEGKIRRNLPTEISVQTKAKKSANMKGKHLTEETKKKLSILNKGKKLSSETKEKISNANKGNISWLKGKSQTKETREKISKSNKGILCCVDKSGNTKRITKSDYKKQEIQDKSLQKWVLNNSNEGKIRLNIKTQRGITCVNKQGICKNIPKTYYNSQKGIKEDWEWVHVKSNEAKVRKLNFSIPFPP